MAAKVTRTQKGDEYASKVRSSKFKKSRCGLAGRLTIGGQHFPCGKLCIATSAKDGRPCPSSRATPNVPYCQACMRRGDASLKVVKHPRFGYILIAARDLPKGYYAGWWGKLIANKNLPEANAEWALSTKSGMIDALPYNGSQLKYSACPGPHEVPTVNFAPNHSSLLGKTKGAQTTMLFWTLRPVPKGTQLTMMYNEDEKSTEVFFKERGIERKDVGTNRYPAIRKPNA